jgi:hypothetical protein
VAFLRHFADDGGAGGLGEAAEFVARIVGEPGTFGKGDGNENRPFLPNGEIATGGVEAFADDSILFG